MKIISQHMLIQKKRTDVWRGTHYLVLFSSSSGLKSSRKFQQWKTKHVGFVMFYCMYATLNTCMAENVDMPVISMQH